MPRPPVDKLLEKVPSKYQLVMAVAKRAKQLTDKKERAWHGSEANPVYLAMQEIADDTCKVKIVAKATDEAGDE